MHRTCTCTSLIYSNKAYIFMRCICMVRIRYWFKHYEAGPSSRWSIYVSNRSNPKNQNINKVRRILCPIKIEPNSNISIYMMSRGHRFCKRHFTLMWGNRWFPIQLATFCLRCNLNIYIIRWCIWSTPISSSSSPTPTSTPIIAIFNPKSTTPWEDSV